MSTRKDDWHSQPRQSRLAAVLYSGLTTEQTRSEMAVLAANERKKAPTHQSLLPDHKRGAVSPLGGVAQPDARWRK